MVLDRRRFRLLSASFLSAAIYACGSAAPSPSPTRPDLFAPPVQIRCGVNPILACTATVFDEGDVTATAVWSAADSVSAVGDQPVRATDAVVFRLPGVPTVTAPHQFYVRADYDNSHGHSSDIATHSYALTPDGMVTPLAYVSGTVRSPATGPLAGATIEIVSGEGFGKTAITIDNGFYLIEFLRLGRSFSLRASKTGYTSQTRTIAGIIDDALGNPSNNSIDFDLQPVK